MDSWKVTCKQESNISSSRFTTPSEMPATTIFRAVQAKVRYFFSFALLASWISKPFNGYDPGDHFVVYLCSTARYQ